MKLSVLLKICLVFSVVYLTLGDIFLPQPYSYSSQQAKHNINKFLIGLFPESDFSKIKRTQTTIDRL